MRKFGVAGLLLLCGLQLAGCPYVAVPTTPGARVKTTLGEFVVRLDSENAPLTVANFRQYVDDDFYDGTIFHRVSAGFVVQGGGYTSNLEAKQTRDPIPCEADNGLSNLRGTIAMARGSDPNSATSQFFINLADNTDLDTTDGVLGYAVFGEVVEGMEVVDSIGALATETRAGFTEIPVETVVIEDVEPLEFRGQGLELTAAGEEYVGAIQLGTVNWALDVIRQLVGFVLIPP